MYKQGAWYTMHCAQQALHRILPGLGKMFFTARDMQYAKLYFGRCCMALVEMTKTAASVWSQN